MSLSIVELATARDAVMMILDELRIDAFLYSLEPKDDAWELIVECACQVNGGWERIELQVPKAMLLGSFDDNVARQRFLEFWKDKLADCKLR
ncbi:MAG: hypothetical protein OEY06_13170 [Gammaproteobacteria bacterium]|nr:hypothetical protein [Gammaproteobacteria bacterium]